MTYADKLKNPRWQKKRLEIMQRDKFTCQLCNDTESILHVHHKEYLPDRKPWEYDDDNFITCCYVCHATVEYLKDPEISILLIQKNKRSDDENKLDVSVFCNIDSKIKVALLRYYINEHEFEFVVTLSKNGLAELIKGILDSEKIKNR